MTAQDWMFGLALVATFEALLSLWATLHERYSRASFHTVICTVCIIGAVILV